MEDLVIARHSGIENENENETNNRTSRPIGMVVAEEIVVVGRVHGHMFPDSGRMI
jgi:hypothetical protein